MVKEIYFYSMMIKEGKSNYLIKQNLVEGWENMDIFDESVLYPDDYRRFSNPITMDRLLGVDWRRNALNYDKDR